MTLYRAVFRSVDRSSVERIYDADQVDFSSSQWCLLWRAVGVPGGVVEISSPEGAVIVASKRLVAAFPRESIVLLETEEDP